MQVIYADVLLAVNLSMDFLTLYLTCRIARRPLSPGRLLAAAVIGGVYGVAALFLEGYPLIGVAIHAAVSVLMCYVACGRPVLGTTALFYGIGCLLGGSMTALWTAVNRFRGETGTPGSEVEPLGARLPPEGLAILALLCGAGALVTAGMARRRAMAGEATLLLAWEDTRVRGRGVIDSANFLTEPVSGTPVILLPQSMGKGLLPPPLYAVMAEGRLGQIPALPPDQARRVRLVPMVSAGGEGVLAAVKPDRCEVDGEVRQVYLAIRDIPRAMIPGDLVKGTER